jgi:hypothetical protein
LEAWARIGKVPFREDETNATPAFLRNRVRGRLTPALRQLAQEFGGDDRFLERFSETVSELRWAADHFQAETARLCAELVTETPYWWRVGQAEWKALEPRWQERVLRRVFSRAAAAVPDRAQLADLLRALARGESGFSASGLQMQLSCGQIFFQTTAQRGQSAAPHRFQRDSRTRQWECAELGYSLGGLDTVFPGADVRFFRPGDQYRGTKLKHRFLEQKIPRLERGFIPVVARPDSDSVLWVFPEPHPGLSVTGPAFPLLAADPAGSLAHTVSP